MTPRIISEQDFLKLYDTHSNEIFRHCYMWLQDREKSIQVMGETFKRLWLFVAAGNAVDSAKIFLYREATLLLEDLPLNYSAEKETEAVEIDADSRLFLSQLEPEARRTCLFYFVAKLSYSEIGEIVGGTVEKHAATVDSIRQQFATPAQYATV